MDEQALAAEDGATASEYGVRLPLVFTVMTAAVALPSLALAALRAKSVALI